MYSQLFRLCEMTYCKDFSTLLKTTVDSLLYWLDTIFLWIFVDTNEPQIQMFNEYNFFLRLYKDLGKNTKFNICENTSFNQSMKVGTHGNRLIPSIHILFLSVTQDLHFNEFIYSSSQPFFFRGENCCRKSRQKK